MVCIQKPHHRQNWLMLTIAQVTWFSETKISLFSFEIKRQHQSPKAGPKVERSNTDFYNFQYQIIWTKLKITSFRFVLYNLEWRLAVVESVVPPLLYSAYSVSSHRTRPYKTMYLYNKAYTFLSTICRYISETYARPAKSVMVWLNGSEANKKFTRSFIEPWICLLLLTSNQLFCI